MKQKGVFTLIFSIVFSFLLVQNTNAQFPTYVKNISLVPNKVVSLRGDLASGMMLSDLSWAWKSSVACFPATQKQKYTGKHVFFHTELPPHSILHIKLIPRNGKDNMSLYAYSIGKGNTSMVPNLSSCVSCETENRWDRPHAGATQNHTRSVRLNAIRNPYSVVIGVAGAEGLSKGEFTLEVGLEISQAQTAEQKTVKMYLAKAYPNKSVVYKGNLSDGTKIYDLSWAWNSSVACFPETQKKKFTGKHILYITEIPKYSIMDIELIPNDKLANMSLYTYEVGVSSKAYVPNLHSCVTCEADYKWDYKKRGKTQNHIRHVKINAINHPYKVVIGVAGADGLDKGGFVLKITTKSK